MMAVCQVGCTHAYAFECHGGENQWFKASGHSRALKAVVVAQTMLPPSTELAGSRAGSHRGQQGETHTGVGRWRLAGAVPETYCGAEGKIHAPELGQGARAPK